MADLIDRAALFADMERTVVFSGRPGDEGMRNANKIIDRIKAAPTIEAKPVVHGKWKLIRKGVFGVASCSNCTCDGFIEYNFCPYCGANMRGET